MRIKYVGGSSAVEVGDQVFKRGHAVEVDDALAGRPPEPRLAEAMAELVTARVGGDHQWQRDLQAEIAGLDYGEGLLAQDIWQAVTPAKKVAAKKVERAVEAPQPDDATPAEPVKKEDDK